MTALHRMTDDDPGPRGREIALGDLACLLDLSGALYAPDERALVMADLHLEKGSAQARRGFFLPPYDTRATLASLSVAIARYEPATVIALGDSFHDVGGPGRLGNEDREAMAELQRGRRWIWITGNHDRSICASVGGDVSDGMLLGSVALRHEPTPGEAPEMAGHLHPVGKVILRGRAVRRRCFVLDGSRCVLPAFGAYTGGLNVCDGAFRPLFPHGFTAYMTGSDRLYAIARPLLCGD